MTTIYLVRHAQPDYSDVHADPENAPLTKQGREDSKKMHASLKMRFKIARPKPDLSSMMAMA